ncbi:MAG: hypothetical protein ACRDD8_03950 [Bacteroidales bacterium]
MSRRTVIDAVGNLWFIYESNNDSDEVRYVLASPPSGKPTEPVHPVADRKAQKWHALRKEQWQSQWYQEWEYKGETYCTGKFFDSLEEICNLPLHDRIIDNVRTFKQHLVYHYGRLFYAYYYPNSGQFNIESVYKSEDGTPTHTGWCSLTTLQPVYKKSNLQTPL